MLDNAPPSRAVERSAFIGYLTFYNKATPSVSLRSTAPSGKEPRELSFTALLNFLPRGGFPSASSQRSKLCKPLRSSRLCSDARCSSSRKTRCAIFAGALFLKKLPRAKPRFCAAGLNLYPQGTFCQIRTSGLAGERAI